MVRVGGSRVFYSLDEPAGGSRYFRLGADEGAYLAMGEVFQANQVIAGQVAPLTMTASRCTEGCGSARLRQMLGSRERTVRFTGCKLARRLQDVSLAAEVRALACDAEEDAYVRMEAKSYLCEISGDSADDLFRATLLEDTDAQMRLEAAVALSETRTTTSFALLCEVLENPDQPLFLRSACAWALGCHGTTEAAEVLVRAFSDVALEIREEALVAVQELGDVAFGPLLSGLSAESMEIAAGAAEALRRIPGAPAREVVALVDQAASVWPTWALAHLPKGAVAPHLAALQECRPEVHYAVSVLWTFLESWIARDWTPGSTP